MDEIWSFVYSKAKNVPADLRGTFGYGDVWTFTAIDADTKLTPSFLVGTRDSACAFEFMQDLASRLVNRVQLTTDGHKMDLSAVEDAFSGNIDFAHLKLTLREALPDTLSSLLVGYPYSYTVAVAPPYFSNGPHIGPAAINAASPASTRSRRRCRRRNPRSAASSIG